jgi:hypothetical protein
MKTRLIGGGAAMPIRDGALKNSCDGCLRAIP